MIRRICLLVGTIAPLFGQISVTLTADRMLAQVRAVQWGRQAGVKCATHIPAQMEIYATEQWTHHCAEVRDGIIRETFFYVFEEPARTSALRVDLRPQDELPQFTTGLLKALRQKLTVRFGPPDHAPELMEIGFRRLHFGQPVAGDHWNGGTLHYFLHANQTNPTPMGMRRGVQLIVMDNRLMEERRRDEFISEVDGLGGLPAGSDPIRTRLETAIGKRDVASLLRDAEGSPRGQKALLLLAADMLVSKLAGSLNDAADGPLRRTLSRHGVKLGGQTHQGGLDYRNDLLWRVWRDFPDTEAGELAFLQLQNRGWRTDTGEGCPPDPDLFREVIGKGEAFLQQHPQSRLRLQVTYTVAVAYESWWSIAHAPADDPIVSAPPYPRKTANAQQSAMARERAIRYYRDVVAIAPQSPEAASAHRRLPRLELSLDTGQRRFFCSFC